MSAPTRIMLDLETLGTAPGSVILSIGAVKFDLEAGVTDTFYRRINPNTCVEAGLIMDPDTLLWWIRQHDDARREVARCGAGEPLLSVLMAFSKWVDGSTAEMWGNGSDFDNVLLAAAYKATGLEQPWKYSGNRCYRTLKNLHPHVKQVDVGIKHHALDDAKAQALHLIEILKEVERRPAAGRHSHGSDEQQDGPGPDFAAGWEEYRRQLRETHACVVPAWEDLPLEVRECWCAGVWEVVDKMRDAGGGMQDEDAGLKTSAPSGLVFHGLSLVCCPCCNGRVRMSSKFADYPHTKLERWRIVGFCEECGAVITAEFEGGDR